MKKTYILLTTLIPLTTTCMELERKKTDVLNIQAQPFKELESNSPLLQFNTLNNLLQPQPLQRPVIQRKYTDRELDYVPVYVTNNTNVSCSTNEIELTPIYRPVMVSAEKRSETEYLDCITNTKKTAPLSPEQKYLTERLYNCTCELIDFINVKEKNMTGDDQVIARNKKFITLIEFMIAAKKKGITEDFMGNLSYEKWNNPIGSFVFCCLKKYLLTIHDSGEKLPFSAHNFYTHSDVTQTLTTTCKEHITTAEQMGALIKNCPTYPVLWDSIKPMISYDIPWIASYLYTSTKILTKEYPQYSHITDINECFDILCCDDPNPHNIYTSLNLIEQIKKLTHITKEKDLGYKFLTFEKKQTYKDKLLWWRSKMYSENKKNLTALFFALVEQYHKDRGNKIIPTPAQVWIYHLLKHIALPDSFDTSLIDTNHYALEETLKLTIDMETFEKKTPEELQILVDQHYIFNEQ
jgi:hypothetical protein